MRVKIRSVGHPGVPIVDTQTLIWVDLRVHPTTTDDLCAALPLTYQVQRIREPRAIDDAVKRVAPKVAFFEYDEPSLAQLDVLQLTCIGYPSLPVVMITVEHSEALAVWALRARVWDYLVMPVRVQDLCSRMAVLCASQRPAAIDVAPRALAAAPSVPDWMASTPLGAAPAIPACSRLHPAFSFVEANYSEKVSLGKVARLCGLGPYQFSRAFKHEQGTTFREFLIIHRISRAIRLLEIPGTSVTDVAFSVGFNDLSYFARMFRRYVGVCPSDYSRDTEVRTPSLPLPPASVPAWPPAKFSYPPATKS